VVVKNGHNDYLSLGAESGADEAKSGAENIGHDTDRDTKNDTDKLTSRETEIVSLIIKNNSISRRTIAQKLGIGISTVS
jgi:hypothetical protein